jgi:hypothetical protein
MQLGYDGYLHPEPASPSCVQPARTIPIHNDYVCLGHVLRDTPGSTCLCAQASVLSSCAASSSCTCIGAAFRVTRRTTGLLGI